jgi:hypothetical protein
MINIENIKSLQVLDDPKEQIILIENLISNAYQLGLIVLVLSFIKKNNYDYIRKELTEAGYCFVKTYDDGTNIRLSITW